MTENVQPPSGSDNETTANIKQFMDFAKKYGPEKPGIDTLTFYRTKEPLFTPSPLDEIVVGVELFEDHESEEPGATLTWYTLGLKYNEWLTFQCSIKEKSTTGESTIFVEILPESQEGSHVTANDFDPITQDHMQTVVGVQQATAHLLESGTFDKHHTSESQA